MTNSKENTQNSWDETLRTIIVAVILAVLFRSFAFEPFHIPSGSMKANLLIGDYLFVSKYSYGYSRYSFPFGPPVFSGRIMELELPQRGDVVVFQPPGNPHGPSFIKRIIGLPGDTIQMKSGVVYINDVAVKREKIDDFLDSDGNHNVKSIPQFAETLPEGKVIDVLKEHTFGPADDTQVFKVPAEHYFMMGDNRDNSRDSRFPDGGVGYVPAENIVGKARIIFFSVDESAHISNPLTWVPALRLNRFMKIIH